MNIATPPSLWDLYAYLKTKTWVDLTHPFGPGIPRWSGFPDEARETLYHYDAGVGTLGAGFLAERYSLVGQWGTHVDPPAHFIRGRRTLDEIGLKEMLLPLVVLDIHTAVAVEPDYTVQLADVERWEQRFGTIPAGAFVALRTDWSARWPDLSRMRNEDEVRIQHFPGWSLPVLQLLFEQRQITACGHETTDTNPGLDCSRGDYSLETYVLDTDHYQVELLAHLDQVPEYGALVVVSFPKPQGGSGFPARVFAILP